MAYRSEHEEWKREMERVASGKLVWENPGAAFWLLMGVAAIFALFAGVQVIHGG